MHIHGRGQEFAESNQILLDHVLRRASVVSPTRRKVVASTTPRVNFACRHSGSSDGSTQSRNPKVDSPDEQACEIAHLPQGWPS